MLAATLAKEDGSRHYTGNSRSLNSSGSGPWRYQFDAGWYYRSLAGGFRSEVGTPSLPTAETVREFRRKRIHGPLVMFGIIMTGIIIDMVVRLLVSFIRKGWIVNWDLLITWMISARKHN